MSQSRRLSLVEAGINVLTGYVLAILLQLFLYPAFGLQVTFAQNLKIAGAFLLVSLLRSYLLRRMFEALAQGRNS
jgi:hypothetical protein